MAPNPDISRALGNIEGKLDLIIERTVTNSQRISELETSRNWMKGVISALGAVVGALGIALKYIAKGD